MDQDQYQTQARERVVYSAIDFTRAVAEFYGAEKGQETLNKIFEAMPDVQGEVFMLMLTGNYGTKVTIVAVDPTHGVETIKAIRRATSLGLKDAKDIYDAVRNGFQKTIEIVRNPSYWNNDVQMSEICRATRHEFVNIGMKIM